MKIVVCVKQVPNTNEIKIDPVKGTLIRDGVESIMNPDDKAGVEAALRIREAANDDTTVTVLTMGPPQAQAVLKEAYAMGCDEAILLTAREFGGADTWATSKTIAAALKKVGFDLIVCGRQAIDGDTAQVGPQIAEHLKISQVSYVADVQLDGNDALIVKRQFEDFYQMVKVKFPCLITTLGGAITPRYMTVGRIFDAYNNMEIKTIGFSDLDIPAEEIGLKGSPTQVKKTENKEAKGKGIVFEDLSPKEIAEKIVAKLQEKFII